MTTEDLHKMIVAYLMLKDDKKADELFEPIGNYMGIYMNRVKYMGLEEIITELPEWLDKLKQARKELKL